MNLIDDYILTHQSDMDLDQLAGNIGLDEELIRKRMIRLNSPGAIDAEPITISQEIYALWRLIEQRKTGCIVDIARQRIVDLNKTRNRSRV